MSDIKAVRLLTTWQRDSRRTVSVTKADYDELLYKVPPVWMGVDQKSGKVEYVVLNKQVATNFLKQEYNLHGLCRNPAGE